MRHLQQMQREELLLGQINCTIGNFSFGGAKRPLTPDLFMLHPLKTPQQSGTDGDRLLAALQSLPPGAAVRVN